MRLDEQVQSEAELDDVRVVAVGSRSERRHSPRHNLGSATETEAPA